MGLTPKSSYHRANRRKKDYHKSLSQEVKQAKYLNSNNRSLTKNKVLIERALANNCRVLIRPLSQSVVRMHQNQISLGYQFKHRDRRTFPNHNLGRQPPSNDFPQRFNCGELVVECPFCQALSFPNEKISCCQNGKIYLEPLSKYPDELKHLYTSSGKDNKNFLANIRKFNNLFAFASTKLTPAGDISKSAFAMGVVRICGQIYHRTGPLHPFSNKPRMYSQLYFYDGLEALKHRRESPLSDKNLSVNVMSKIQSVMDRCNPFAASYRLMRDVEMDELVAAQRDDRVPNEVRMFFHEQNPLDGRLNKPLHEEVAAVFTGKEGAPPEREYIVIESNGTNGNNLKILNDLSEHVDPMSYPILFPNGDPGFKLKMPHIGDNRTEFRNQITLREFYNSRLSIRNDVINFNPIFFSGSLTQQYMIDAYVKIEANRLQYLRFNQANLRVDKYKIVSEFLKNNNNQNPDGDNPSLGVPVIFPSSYDGSPRSQVMRYQDAMAVVSKFGRPDLFVTITCNPKWPEIVQNLKLGQTALGAPHLVSRVFKIYLDKIITEIYKEGILGKVVAFIEVIEFQKRGLPHAHLLIHLKSEDKLNSPQDVDNIISAEIPDKNLFPLLHATVTANMVHGPCGSLNPNSPCMKNVDGKLVCKSGYPKNFSESTTIGNSYPKYKRREVPETEYTKKFKGKPYTIDNRDVVPYNHYLSQKFNCHINVESCQSIVCVKYLFKYCYKGHDKGTLRFEQSETTEKYDEIKKFVQGRYVSACEAVWRIFAFGLHRNSHTVNRLPVHLPEMQPVYFNDGDEQDAMDNIKETKLTAFFELNKQNVYNTKELIYSEVVHDFIFEKGVWRMRKKNSPKPLLGRLYNVSPRDVERYHLRILLRHIKGPTSFEYLRTVNNEVLPSFKEACISLGLVENDNQYYLTLMETVLYASPLQSRQIFAYLLIFCEVSDALRLWSTFAGRLCEDFLHQGLTHKSALESGLGHIQSILLRHGNSLTIHGLPSVSRNSCIIQTKSNTELKSHCQNLRKTLYKDQEIAATNILRCLFSSTNISNKHIDNMFFVDGPGGSGKTYLYNFLVSVCKAFHLKVSCSAYSGVAATLLENGSTCHSVFKLPVPCTDGSKCHVSPSSEYGKYLKEVDMFIIDEVSMMNKYAFEAIDIMLQDVCKNKNPFGGKIMVFGGDFRQTLPIVKHGSADQIIDQCVVSSDLWSNCQRLTLNKNMRADSNNSEFSQFILKMGSNKLKDLNCPSAHECIELPSQCVLNKIDELNVSPSTLINEIFPVGICPNEIQKRVILTPTNKSSLEINDEILKTIPGEIHQSFSYDTAISDDLGNNDLYPVDFLNSINCGGAPPHILNLKKGCIIMLLKNLDIQAGLSNGTRLVLKHVHSSVLEAEILCGAHAGNKHFIPKVFFQPSDVELPFTLKRFQFPVRLAYSMTINKSQGQSFSKVGIYLERSCFGHGQLYVAFSRGRSFDGVKIVIRPDQNQGVHSGKYHTKNVVFQRVFDLCEHSCRSNAMKNNIILSGSQPILEQFDLMSNHEFTNESSLCTPSLPLLSNIITNSIQKISKHTSKIEILSPEKTSPIIKNLSDKFDKISRESVFGKSVTNASQQSLSDFGSIHFVIEGQIYPEHICGLFNLGNTCYVNSIIQILRIIPDLFVLNQTNQTCSILAISFRGLMASMNFRNSEAPYDFINKLQQTFINDFNVHAQQDVPDILQRMLNNFSRCGFITQNKIEIMYRQFTKCTVCKTINSFTDSNIICPLTISFSIQTSLNQFYESVSLSGENRYQCDRCGCLQDASQYTKITQTPKYIFFQLKRSRHVNGEFSKDHSPVRLDRNIEVKVNIGDGLEQLLPYELVGTIHHIGNTWTNGHYISYTNVDNQWNKCDDNHTSISEFSQIETRSGYVVIYRSSNP